jgi:hypothetical protein
MVRVSADSKTREDLNIMTEEVPEDQARRVVEKVSDNPNYKASLAGNMLIIQRFLRD